MYKYFTALIIIALVGLAFWFNLNSWLKDPFGFSDSSFKINNFLFIVLWLFISIISLFSLSFLLFKQVWQKLSFMTVIFGMFLVVFGYDKLYLAGLAIAFLVLYPTIGRFKTEVEEHLKINIWHIMQRAIPGVVTSFLILVSFAYFLTPSIQSAGRKSELPPTFQKIVHLVVTNFGGGKGNIDPNILKATEKEVIRQFNNILSPYYKFLPPILAFGLFLLLQGFSFLFVWLGALFSVLLFWIFKKNGIVSIETIKKDAEMIKF